MKKLETYGICNQDFQNAHEAASHTYMTRDGRLVSTPLIFADNPFNEQIKNAKLILDLGCGVGRNAKWILENTEAIYVGIDPNPSMLKYFWDYNDRKYEDRVLLYGSFGELLRNLSNFTLNYGTFDVVVCTFVFQHIGFRPAEGQMNVVDITREAMKFCRDDTVWFLYEHDWEEQWIERWMDELDLLPQVYKRDYAGIPEIAERNPHHLIIFQNR